MSIASVKERVIRLSSERLRATKKEQIALTERQMKIIERINTQGFITNRMIQKIFNLSDEGSLKEINKLVRLDVVKPEGKCRSIKYNLA